MKNRRGPVAVLAALCWLITAATAQTEPKPKLVNAASPAYGARVTVTAGAGVVKDRQTRAADLLDGNAHTRYVVTGTPYTIAVELPFKVPVERFSLAQSDYATEAAPKELDIAFDDGQVLHPTLELKRSLPRRPAWQDVPVEREVKSFTVTVRSNYDGEVKWGGLADIAVWTSTDLDAKFRVPGYDPAAPVFVHAPPVGVAAGMGQPVKVTLPAVAQPGEHPCLIFTPAELKQFRALGSNAAWPAGVLLAAGRSEWRRRRGAGFPRPQGSGCSA